MTERPLRILLAGDYTDDPRLGSAKVAHKLREELRSAGHECDVLFANDLGRRPAGRQVRQLVAPVLAARAIGRALARRAYDVVDVASAEGFWFGASKRLGARPRTAFICRSNGLEHLNYRRMIADARCGLLSKPWTRRLWYPASRLSQVAAAARLADRLVVLNETDRRFALASGWQPAGRIDVVPHGVSDRFLAGAPAATRGAGALFCGSWDHVKGISYLVEAFDALAARGAPVPLTVLGPGAPARDVVQSFSERMRPHVTVLDRMPEDEVVRQYRRHDLLVFPSTYEGFGLVVLEAMSQGLPVVATAAGCVPSLIRDGETGVIVPFRDSAALADAVSRLMADPGTRLRLAQYASAIVSDMSWRRTAALTVESYRRALRTTSPRGDRS